MIKSFANIVLGQDYILQFGDKNLTLGKGIMKVGSPLPDMSCLVTPELTSSVMKSERRKVILTVPSLDTPVCEHQIKSLSNKVDEGKEFDVIYYVVSVDTPFAQSRFIKLNNINPAILFLSDYAEHQFMNDTGLRIQELHVFARAIIECDKNNVVQSVTIPLDISHLP